MEIRDEDVMQLIRDSATNTESLKNIHSRMDGLHVSFQEHKLSADPHPAAARADRGTHIALAAATPGIVAFAVTAWKWLKSI